MRPQATEGNLTDWETVADSLHNVGYPIADVSPDGSCDIYKPKTRGGIVNRGTVAEQLLYEIGDPAAYILPDVVCDFTQIKLEQVADNRVRVSRPWTRRSLDLQDEHDLGGWLARRHHLLVYWSPRRGQSPHLCGRSTDADA